MHLSCVYAFMGIFLGGLHICEADKNSDSPSIFDEFSKATLSEDGKLNFTQLVTKYGQTVEQFDVVTEDGYILTLFHVPGNSQASKKPPILLFHGVANSCDSFLIRGNSSMVITLATAGYDVWIGNDRGNLYGRRHVSLNPDTDTRFWDFSFHEIGYYDHAAIIDFVRENTNSESVFTVGHSQGTTAHFALTSLRPEYNERIKLFIALAPVAFLNNLVPPVSILAATGPAIAAVLRVANVYELLRDHSATSNLITFICSKGVVGYLTCGFGVLFPALGFDPKGVEEEFLTGVVIGHFPRGTSRKSLEHLDQVVLRKRFAQYDYGILKNVDEYGSASPPDYDLAKVTAKVALFVGGNDPVANLKDVEHLRDSLPNVVHHEVMKPKQWSHVDFIFGKDIMAEYLYPAIFKLLETYA